VRKIQASHYINWLEILPRDLRQSHDLSNTDTGFAAYQMLFEIKRPLRGLPIFISQNHAETETETDAKDVFGGIEVMDLFVLHNLNMDCKRRTENL